MTTYPTLNVELLDKVLQHIENDPKHWAQNTWRTHLGELFAKVGKKDVLTVDCGTAFCFAGWACQMATEGKHGAKWYNSELLWANKHDKKSALRDDVFIEADDRAQRLLGITEEEAEDLFSGSNSLDAVKSYIEDIKAGVYRRG